MGSFLSSLIFRNDGDEAAETLTLLELLSDLQGGPPPPPVAADQDDDDENDDEVQDNHNEVEEDDDNDDTSVQEPNINWEVMIRRLRRHPEEAAAYCQTIDASPLLRCLLLPYNVPVRVIRAFVDAYDDAVFHADRHGTTPLLAAMMSMSSTTSSSSTTEEEEEENTWNRREIVQVLLQANPDAIRQSDRKGRLPLHYVRSDLSMARDLIGRFPEAVNGVDKAMGRLPLHYYCCFSNHQGLMQSRPSTTTREDENHHSTRRQSTTALSSLPDPQVARLLLETAMARGFENPVLRKDRVGLTPLDILYKELTILLEKDGKNQSTKNHDNKAVNTLWEVLMILVQSAAMMEDAITTTTTTSKFQMVHALVALQCPAIVMREALRRDPQQAVERDAQGRTPLLMAVELLDCNAVDTTTSSTTTKNLQQIQRDQTPPLPRQQPPRDKIDSVRAAAVCVELIHCNRAAARMMDREGRLAIDLLSEKGFYHEELFEALVNAEPRAVITRDLKNKQHPFLTAALAPSGRSNVASVYHLLRAEPHVIQFFLGDTK